MVSSGVKEKCYLIMPHDKQHKHHKHQRYREDRHQFIRHQLLPLEQMFIQRRINPLVHLAQYLATGFQQGHHQRNTDDTEEYIEQFSIVCFGVDMTVSYRRRARGDEIKPFHEDVIPVVDGFVCFVLVVASIERSMFIGVCVWGIAANIFVKVVAIRSWNGDVVFTLDAFPELLFFFDDV